MKSSILLFLCTAMSGAIAAPATTTPATTLPPPPTPFLLFGELDPYIPEGYDMGFFLKNGTENGTEIMLRTRTNVGFTVGDKQLVEEKLRETIDLDDIAKAFTTEVERRQNAMKMRRHVTFHILGALGITRALLDAASSSANAKKDQ